MEAEITKVPLKPGKDPIESFFKPRKVSGIRVESPSCGWLRRKGFGSSDLQLEGQVSSCGERGLTNTNQQCATRTGSCNSSLL